MELKLQYFGGRGSGGGKSSGGGGGSRISAVEKDEKVQAVLEAANASWKSGEEYYFKDDGPEESFEISYRVRDDYSIEQLSDGKAFDGSYIQRMVEGEDAGKYHVFGSQGEYVGTTASASKAVKMAWGTPKSQGYARKRKK